MFVGLFYLTLLGYTLAGALLQRLAAKAGGVTITEIRIFFGKSILKFTWRGTPVTVGCLPFGTFYRYDPEQFATRPLWARLLPDLVPLVAFLLPAGILLGIDVLIPEVLAGFRQVLMGAISPHGQAQQFLSKLAELYASNPGTAIGIVGAKNMCVAYLPIVGPQFQSLLTQLVHPLPRDENSRWAILEIVSALLAFGMMVLWGVALLLYLL